MTIPEDFKTRLKIAKSKIKNQVKSDMEKKGSFMGSAFKLSLKAIFFHYYSNIWKSLNKYLNDNYVDTFFL